MPSGMRERICNLNTRRDNLPKKKTASPSLRTQPPKKERRGRSRVTEGKKDAGLNLQNNFILNICGGKGGMHDIWGGRKKEREFSPTETPSPNDEGVEEKREVSFPSPLVRRDRGVTTRKERRRKALVPQSPSILGKKRSPRKEPTLSFRHLP